MLQSLGEGIIIFIDIVFRANNQLKYIAHMLRQTFIPIYYYNIISMFKLIDLLKSENRNVLIKLCKFIKLAFNHRN